MFNKSSDEMLINAFISRIIFPVGKNVLCDKKYHKASNEILHKFNHNYNF